MFCLFCFNESPLSSPVAVSSTPLSTPPLSRRASSTSLSPAITKTSPDLIKSSPSQRFPHISPQVMKILSPETEMPVIAPDCHECAAHYRVQQDKIINKLMGFIKEEQ